MRGTRARDTSGLHRTGAALAALALAATLTACGGAQDGPASGDSPDPGMTTPGTATEEPMASEPMTSEPMMTEPMTEAMDAPAAELAVTGTTVDGEPLDLVAHLGGRPAVLWFWAPWCPVCAAEADEVAAQAAASSGEVTFVGVAAHDDVAAMQGFVERHGLEGFEHLADEEGAVWERFGVSAQPAYAFVTADGTVRVVPSSLGAEELAAEVARLTAG